MRSSGEVASAVAFVCHTVMDGGFPVDHELLSAELERLCNDRWEGHWHPENPERGSGFRCISVESGRLDPLLREACVRAGAPADAVDSLLLPEFAVWTDPGRVSVRMGSGGPIWPLETFNNVGSPSKQSRALDPWAKEWMPSHSDGSSSASSSP